MNKTEIVNAWATIRKENNSITDEVLDFMKDAAIEKLQSISQPKGAEESWEEMRKALNCMEGSDWDIFCMKNNIYAAMQSFASQQCAEKDKEIAELKAAVSKQDEMIGRLTRERDNLRDTEDKRQEWLDKAKSDFGVHRNTSFDEVWAKTLSAYKENENLKAELKKSQQPEVNRLGEIVGTFPDLPPYEKDNTTQQQPEVSEDWKNKFREFCASHEGNKSGDLRVMHVEAVINWIERNQLFEPQPVQGESEGWVRVGERLPTKEDADENGKVLLYRNMNDSQKSLSKSIHDYFMVKNCDKDSFWRPLPSPPKANK
jgi:hypothetical protein